MDSMRMNLNVFLVWRNANYVQITLVVHNVWKKEIFLIQQQAHVQSVQHFIALFAIQQAEHAYNAIIITDTTWKKVQINASSLILLINNK